MESAAEETQKGTQGVQGLGFRVWGLGFRVQGLRAKGLGFRVEDLGTGHSKRSSPVAHDICPDPVFHGFPYYPPLYYST